MDQRAIERKVRFSVCAGKWRGGASGEKEAHCAFVLQLKGAM